MSSAVSNTDAAYRYKSLDPVKNEIRVLRVSSGEQFTELRCDLEHISLDDAADYQALSYAWHDPSLFPEERRQQKELLRIGDQYLKIGSNLLSFLNTARITNSVAKYLWVDAICINHNDVKEKNAQILRMKEIYSSARQVIVWLGPQNGDSDKALELLTFVSKNCPVGHEAEWFRVLLRSPPATLQWNALTRLFWRVWWSRIWIVQEVVLAKDVVVFCGTASLSWTDLDYGIANIAEALDDTWKTTQVFGGLSIVRDRVKAIARLTLLRRRRDDFSTLRIIDSVGGNECANQRDKIYGLLGMIKDANEIVPTPDYTRSPENVYRNFFVSLAQKTGNLDFLSLVHNRIDDANSTLPTWCPDLRARDYRIPARLNTSLLFPADNGPKFRACGTKSSAVRSSRDKSALSVLGICVDHIDGVFPGGFDNSLILKYTIQARSTANAYATSEEAFQALWQTFVGGLNLASLTKDHAPPDDFQELFVESCCAAEEEHLKLCTEGKETLFDVSQPLKLPVFLDSDLVRPFNTWYKYNRTAMFAGQSVKSWVQANIALPSAVAVVTPVKEFPSFSAFKQSWSNAASARRIVTTEKGYIGMVPELCRRGDLICVLFGCSVPVVLRPKDGHYLFIGESYVHGLMDGEAVEDFKKGVYKVEEFELR
jgi:hypothetical protein